MGLRANDEIESSFRLVEQELDAALEESREHLEGEGVSVRNESNRSGFDGSGFPSFVWQYYFERRAPYGSEIKLAVAQLSYREPVFEDDHHGIVVATVAEIFQIGKQSRVKETGEKTYSIRFFLDTGLRQVVMKCITAAENALAKR